MKKLLIGFLVFDLVLVNVGIIFLIYKTQVSDSKISDMVAKGSLDFARDDKTFEYVDQCGSECQKYIDNKVGQLASTPVSQSSPTVKPVYVAPTRARVRTVTYVTIPGSGYSTSNDWQSIESTGFYFDTRDYPGLVEIYYEATMKLFNGNGSAYTRLFDVTNGVGVQGSEIQTTSQSDTLVASGKINFWSGKNLIKVQAKSLTADTSIFSSGRLRIVTEN